MNIWRQAIDDDGYLINSEIVDDWSKERTRCEGRGILCQGNKRREINRATEHRFMKKESRSRKGGV